MGRSCDSSKTGRPPRSPGTGKRVENAVPGHLENTGVGFRPQAFPETVGRGGTHAAVFGKARWRTRAERAANSLTKKTDQNDLVRFDARPFQQSPECPFSGSAALFASGILARLRNPQVAILPTQR